MARRRYGYGYGLESRWPAYVPAAARRREAEKEIAALRKKGRTIEPIVLEGTKIARTFWGKAWCENLESYSDYANRLPRGRSYVRSGSVLHLAITKGKVEAVVRGTETYTVSIAVTPIARRRWDAVVRECSGQVGSLVELLRGNLSKGVMKIVTNGERGLFPAPKEIVLACSCPDWATMCKHVAAAMYGVGARLDHEPALLFRLRGVDEAALLSGATVGRAASAARAPARRVADEALESVFGIDLDVDRSRTSGGTARTQRGSRVKTAAKAITSKVTLRR